MAAADAEVSLLKLVLAAYLQVLELHLFAILQNAEDFNVERCTRAILIRR